MAFLKGSKSKGIYILIVKMQLELPLIYTTSGHNGAFHAVDAIKKNSANQLILFSRLLSENPGNKVTFLSHLNSLANSE